MAKYLLILAFLYIDFCFGQNIRHISESEGLPQSFISGIVQDNQGFVWIATRNGLSRYDGHTFQIFQKIQDSASLASNAITHLKKDINNTLWVKYETGEIDLVDMATGKVQHILTPKNISQNHLYIMMRGWCPGKNSSVWYMAQGGQLHRFSYAQGRITLQKGHTFTGDTLRSLLKDTKNRLWVLSQKGLHLYNDTQNSFSHYKIPYRQQFNDELDYGDDIPELHEMPGGNLMWTDLKSIFLFNPKTAAYSTLPLPERPDYSVRWISTGPDGREYFAAGQNLYSYGTGGLTRHTAQNMPGLQTIQAFLVDNSGLVWTGGNSNGITQIDLSTKFESHAYKGGFAVDVLNTLGIAGNLLPPDRPLYKGILPQSYYLRSVKDGNYIYIALNRTVLRYNDIDGTTTPLPTLPRAGGGFCPIKGLCSKPGGGLYAIDASGRIYILNNESWQQQTVKSNGLKLAGIEPNYMYASGNCIWVTTEYGGLFYIDASFHLHKLSGSGHNTAVNGTCHYTIAADPSKKDILWIGSPQGLLCLNTNTLKGTLYSVKDGLPDNVIYSILPDGNGFLWMGTNKGLACFNPITHKCRVYSLSHGLPNNEFNRFHQMPLPGGRMAFGGINGYVIFNPSDLKADGFSPATAITALYINNQLYGSSGNAALALPQKLRLPHNENTLTIEYAALQFSHPDDIKYRYRLKGYDTGWVYAETGRQAVYTKLPPGHYTFEVNATNTTGKWSSKITSVPIRILPPWWSTWWAWVLYIAIAAGCLVLFVNFRIRQRVMKTEMLLTEKEARQLRELDEVKMRFFTNIAHELRTPLTLILGPAGELERNAAEPQSEKLAGVIIKNADSLLNLTNQLLDMAKLEAGALQPRLQAGDVVLATKKITAAFAQDAKAKGISIAILAPDTAGFLFDADMYYRILGNLLSNALRFSPPGGTIAVNLAITGNGITIDVTDEGPGIAPSEAARIFTRFYSNNPQQGAGYGVGLSLVKEFVALQGGTITVVSDPEKQPGACFRIYLPLRAYADAPAESAVPPPGVEESAANEEKPTILVAEDNAELAAFIHSILSPLYTILSGEDGTVALPLAKSHVPDLIISDVLMPKMGGYDLCRALKEDIGTSHIPVLLLTAKADMQSRLDGLSIGADDYITKPFSVEELLMRVHNRLIQQQRFRENIYRQLTTLPQQNVTEATPVETDPFLLKVYAIIDQNIDNDAFGSEELAGALSLSRASLHRKAKALSGMASSELLRSYRLQKAALLLKENGSIAEVAYKTGFSSPSYFTRSFKECYGITPTEYVKNNTLQQ